ncbi:MULTISPECIES: sugar ABC transporter substrate-binding protein [Kitasatospora]|uniref:Sugar ABC transporter substrate-binding protein n=1 Tax=Kitasatospora cystarginea TaxID=58350 RepID=A0ABP5R8L4_9ACTN
MHYRKPRATVAGAAAGAVLVAGTLTGCSGHSSGAGARDAGAAIGVDLPRDDSDFWKSYAQYLKAGVAEQGLDSVQITESHNDDAQLKSNLQKFEKDHVKAVAIAPQSTQNTEALFFDLFSHRINAVSVDTEPEHGEVYMVVRADNVAYGTKACEFLGKQLGGKGKVAELQGALSSINGYERSRGFATCMKKQFPGIQVIELATDWKGDVASAKLQSTLAANPDLKGVYMQAGGVFLQPTLTLLQQKGLLKPAGQSGHIAIVSNDGIPQELDAIRRGDIDATVSQPADLYAKYALYYAQAAAENKSFHTGPTDHDSTIISLPNGMEDRLPAPLVTKDNVDDKTLWGNHIVK